METVLGVLCRRGHGDGNSQNRFSNNGMKSNRAVHGRASRTNGDVFLEYEANDGKGERFPTGEPPACSWRVVAIHPNTFSGLAAFPFGFNQHEPVCINRGTQPRSAASCDRLRSVGRDPHPYIIDPPNR